MRKKWIIAIIFVICTTLFIIINTARMNKSEAVNITVIQDGVIQETIFASGKLNSTTETLQYIQHNGYPSRRPCRCWAEPNRYGYERK
jgi:hypothetical protein